jgi:hypothetical protein
MRQKRLLPGILAAVLLLVSTGPTIARVVECFLPGGLSDRDESFIQSSGVRSFAESFLGPGEPYVYLKRRTTCSCS